MICEYGCGQEAEHRFKNGKWCCSKHYSKCSGNKKRCVPWNKGKKMKKGWGFSGKKHTKETKEKQRKGMKKWWANAPEEDKNKRDIIRNYWSNSTEEQRKNRARKISISLTGKSSPQKGTKRSPIKYCKSCGKEIYHLYTFCGNCFRGENCSHWIEDREQRFAPYTEKHFDRDIRQRIFEEQSGKCGYCGDKNYSLHLHHIDYDKQNDERWNKMFLCLCCHTRTNGSPQNRNYWQDKLENLNILYMGGGFGNA